MEAKRDEMGRKSSSKEKALREKEKLFQRFVQYFPVFTDQLEMDGR